MPCWRTSRCRRRRSASWRGFAPRPTVVASDGADHRRLRAPLNRGLSSARVSALLAYAQQWRLLCADPALVPAAVAEGARSPSGTKPKTRFTWGGQRRI
ncbi:hypothetical protein AB0D54_06930 [Streptomyces xanthophaeus]|uniref:hypothetical protein n=1 Tax=Streptomyces xanthophaeus TaxID=67385 RepID=UPI00344A15EE